MRSAQTLLNVFACAETRIDQTALLQDLQSVTVGILAVTLTEGVAIPIQA